MPPLALDFLAVELCQAVRDVRSEPQTWVDIDRIRDRLGAVEPRTVDAAMAFASAKGWLSIDGRPAHSILLTRDAP
jgi:hypothetical protein